MYLFFPSILFEIVPFQLSLSVYLSIYLSIYIYIYMIEEEK